ncbi:MAG: hypothetical protein ALECFALPRED_003691 [Alectoria fallacina]|uniref:Uncharacterized protein n=1 Tax=Alectoria fallacina TaxID=1903189 RepID=A0A8H3FQU1_9LECA|nr:MAG: hypothetical protein ALECFALPRED_003691 [Alectoria fallacina]
MSPRAPILLTLACLFQLLQTAPVHSASIPPSLSLAITNATFNGNPAYCNNYEGWVGAGIARGDCTEAIAEFYRTNVEPRGGQRFEFLTRGVPRNTHLPYIVTPRKHDYGICVVVITMLDTFHGTLPGGKPQLYTRADTATFDEVYVVAEGLASECVKKHLVPEAGWSFADRGLKNIAKPRKID